MTIPFEQAAEKHFTPPEIWQDTVMSNTELDICGHRGLDKSWLSLDAAKEVAHAQAEITWEIAFKAGKESMLVEIPKAIAQACKNGYDQAKKEFEQESADPKKVAKMKDNMPVFRVIGCVGCQGTAGRAGCFEHGSRNIILPVTSKILPEACIKCGRALEKMSNYPGIWICPVCYLLHGER